MSVRFVIFSALVGVYGCSPAVDADVECVRVAAAVVSAPHVPGSADAGVDSVAIAARVPRYREHEQLNLLFIGNSYTRFNQLPLLVKRIADSVPHGPRVAVSMVAHGGYRLADHIRVGAAARAIANRHPTHVILQDRSDAFLHAAEYRKGVATLRAQAARVGAEVLLYETWARSDGDLIYRDEVVRTPAEMLSRARALCESVDGSSCVPVGRSFAAWNASHHGEALIRRDRSHPTLVGSYLAALTFYEAIAATPIETPRYFPYQSEGCFAQGRAEQCASDLLSVAHQVVTDALTARAVLPETTRAQTTTQRTD